jgi:hypothetical protein
MSTRRTLLALAIATSLGAGSACGSTDPYYTPSANSPWSSLVHPAPFNPGAMLLLTDGQILVQDQGPNDWGSSGWWLLSPDATGSYVDGTWTRAASLPAGYGPISFASAVLPDGRVLIEGGEDNIGNSLETNEGALYDPVTNRWATIAPPTGLDWAEIGDAPSVVLPDGSFMLGAADDPSEATFNASTLTWTRTGAGKADANSEEGWTLLPNGDVLTVDVAGAPNTEIFNSASGVWRSAGSTPASLVDSTDDLGPDILMPDGVVLATGATGRNATYNTATGVWSAAPSFPVIDGQRYDIADGPAAVLPDGDVLLMASPGAYEPPTRFFIFDGTSLKQVPPAPQSSIAASYNGYMLVLPTGQIMLNTQLGSLYIYRPTSAPNSVWQPTITSVPTALAPGRTYRLTGLQLNGLTQGAAYGDDFQDATNYPLVRITNTRSGRAFYARTSGMTSMSVAPGQLSSTNFAIPSDITSGRATLVVVANGIASAPVHVAILNR